MPRQKRMQLTRGTCTEEGGAGLDASCTSRNTPPGWNMRRNKEGKDITL